MPTTTNFGWTLPTPGGDTGVWDTILNAAFDEVDADLEVLYDEVGTPTARMLISAAAEGNGSGWSGPSTSSLVSVCANVATASNLLVPLSAYVRPGWRITGFRARAARDATATATVSLSYLNDAGTPVEVSAGHAIAEAESMTETTGLTHDVAADRVYYIKVTPGGTGSCYVVHVALDLIAVP